MSSPHRIFLASVLGAALFAATAHAEKTFPVNDSNTGLFDQPSVAMAGSTAHVAFIGGPGPAGPFRVYYAAVKGGANFKDLALDRSTVLTTPPAAVDNTAPGNDGYFDARHPVIALRSSTEAVIFFQAKPTSSSDPAYSLYRARIRLENNAVAEQRVNLVSGIPPGDIEDVSFAIVKADNTARVVYANRTAIAPTEPFQLSFARIGLDNAAAAAPVAITSAYPASQGYRPVPSLKLDDRNRAHIAWAAESAPGSSSGPVYYAMIKETNGVDNMVIAPTDIMTGYTEGYSFPSLLVFNRNLITVIASDEALGELSYVQIRPDAAHQDGLPAWDNLANRDSFKLKPPGEPILPAYRLFRPEAFYEASSGRIFITGYRGRDDGTSQAGVTFFAFKLNVSAASADPVTVPDPFVLVDRPSGIDNDYTKAVFGFPGGKVVVFWSQEVSTGSANRNVNVTTVSTVAAWVSSSESGCAMVPYPRRGAAGRIPGALLLFVPAAVLAGRRILVKRRRPRATIPDARRHAGGTIGR